jgi:DNA modification methylase
MLTDAHEDRFDVADAAALPWPDDSVDLLVTSPPYALDVCTDLSVAGRTEDMLGRERYVRTSEDALKTV